MINNYEKLIDKDKYQIFLFKSKANSPFIFAVHSWFVLNKMGEISRWDVGFSNKYMVEKKWGHLYKNLYLPTQGLEIFPYIRKFFWKSKMINIIEGEEAVRIISFVEKSPENYPYLNKYRLLGPNSNTYTQWIINSFPESNLRLPFNAIGKNYKIND